MTTLSNPRYRGLFPVVPTCFTEDGALDLASQKRCVDFMIDAGSDGLAILANFSEQFLLADAEREVLTRAILEHVAGRVPVIVTTTHTSSRVCIERSRQAQAMGQKLALAPAGVLVESAKPASVRVNANVARGLGLRLPDERELTERVAAPR